MIDMRGLPVVQFTACICSRAAALTFRRRPGLARFAPRQFRISPQLQPGLLRHGARNDAVAMTALPRQRRAGSA
ncbi:hypothetical protein ACQR0V_07175 [Bradyrhizobium sp. HKCCYLS2058]|uniref:hypothetical protein n=1 Tax=unclassified Bradyrhizobium TaxID=2631580 RepID=UPI003EBC2A2D